VLADYVDSVDLATPRAVPPVVGSDPDDDQIVAAAVAADADLLVSGDRHLLSLASHRRIRIVTPAEALARITP
jgi:predicted nucleic acid-binding protein